jgi:hypothetical protein
MARIDRSRVRSGSKNSIRMTGSQSRSSGTISRIAKKTKRYGKQTLRDLLLSKTFHSGFKVLIGILISSSALYGAYALIGTSVSNDIVVSQSEIIARIGKHVELPKQAPDAVVRVQDAESLKKQVGLFENVKVGDYIVIYPTLAVVYDLYNDRIVALKTLNR